MSGIAAGRLREERKAWRKGKNISKNKLTSQGRVKNKHASSFQFLCST